MVSRTDDSRIISINCVKRLTISEIFLSLVVALNTFSVLMCLRILNIDAFFCVQHFVAFVAAFECDENNAMVFCFNNAIYVDVRRLLVFCSWRQ